MKEFINNFADLAVATWDLFRMYPGYSIIMLIGLIVAVFIYRCIKKDLIEPDFGGPTILL